MIMATMSAACVVRRARTSSMAIAGLRDCICAGFGVRGFAVSSGQCSANSFRPFPCQPARQELQFRTDENERYAVQMNGLKTERMVITEKLDVLSRKLMESEYAAQGADRRLDQAEGQVSGSGLAGSHCISAYLHPLPTRSLVYA